MLKVSSIFGYGYITADGGQGNEPSCSGADGGVGSGGVVHIEGAPLNQVKASAEPRGVVSLRTTIDQHVQTPATTTLAPYVWELSKKSGAYCSYCTSCRFLERNHPTPMLEGQACLTLHDKLRREASIAGGGCSGHCGCNVHNRVDYDYTCVLR